MTRPWIGPRSLGSPTPSSPTWEAWQSRPLDSIYPVLLVDGIRIKIRDGSVTNRVVYVVMGINMDGQRDILGLWVGPTGGESRPSGSR